MRWSHIIDWGSRSIKLYRYDKPEVHLLRSSHWDPINAPPTERAINDYVSTILDDLPASQVLAVGTAAMRRDRWLAGLLEASCTARNLAYQTITQDREALLIRRATACSLSRDIFNVGGGSIQIVRPDGTIVLLDYGISDLNKNFDLTAAPTRRRLAECAEFVRETMPSGLGEFVYTGGEATYLRSLGIPLAEDNYCWGHDFRWMSQTLAKLELDEIEALSPFGWGWMSGAVASNLIVESALASSGQDGFFPSDVNIAHGLVVELLEYNS